MAMRMRNLVAASILIGGAAVVGSGPPAAADYAPFVIIDPVKGPAGTAIHVTNDDIGWCATTTQAPGQNIQPGVPGTVVVEFGSLATPPNIGGVVVLDEVLDTATVAAGADGSWHATLTVPAGTPPGAGYAVTGHCDVPVIETTTTTATSTSTSTTGSTTPPDPATATRSAQRDLLFDYYPARFTVTVTGDPGPTTTTPPSGAPPATAVAGQADFTG